MSEYYNTVFPVWQRGVGGRVLGVAGNPPESPFSKGDAKEYAILGGATISERALFRLGKQPVIIFLGPVGAFPGINSRIAGPFFPLLIGIGFDDMRPKFTGIRRHTFFLVHPGSMPSDPGRLFPFLSRHRSGSLEKKRCTFFERRYSN